MFENQLVSAVLSQIKLALNVNVLVLANHNAINTSNITSQTNAREMNKIAVLFAILLEF